MSSVMEMINHLQGQKITDNEFNGRRISELPDVVVNNGNELKKMFDAAAINVITPKYNGAITLICTILELLKGDTTSATAAAGSTAAEIESLKIIVEKIKTVSEALEDKATEIEGNLKNADERYSAAIAAVNDLIGTIGKAYVEADTKAINDHDAETTAHSLLFKALESIYAQKNHQHEDYAETGHKHDAQEIEGLPTGGGMKLLWSGNAGAGNLTVPGFQDYTLFAVKVQQTLVICQKSWAGMFGYFGGIGTLVAGSNIRETLIYASYNSGSDTINLSRIETWARSAPPSLTLSEYTTTGNTVTEIYGIA